MANVKVYDDNNHVEGFMPFSGGSDSSDSQSNEPIFYIFQVGNNQPIKKMVKTDELTYEEQSSSMNEFFEYFWSNSYTARVCIKIPDTEKYYSLILDYINYYGSDSNSPYFSKNNSGYYSWRTISNEIPANASLSVDSGEISLQVNSDK